MKRLLAILAVLIIAVIFVVFFSSKKPGIFSPFQKNPTASINNHTFSLTVAKSSDEKQIGLSQRQSLAENQGMLFPFGTPEYYAFWMKNMKFPIDIIYLRNNRIVTIYKNVQPPGSPTDAPAIYKPDEPADTVLEIKAGLSDKYKLKKGDTVKLENVNEKK